MPITYRPARAAELQTAENLVARSINELTERHGFGTLATARPASFQLFSLQDDPDGLWVAEEGDEILGFALSWVCGDLWFLAELFVSPDHQGRGIGNELMKRTLQHAQKSGATNRALITFAFNRVSQGLYLRHGLFPRIPLSNFGVAREALVGRLQGAHLRCERPQDTDSDRRNLVRIDERVLGVSREKHHRYLINDKAMRGALLYAKDECVGYVYVNSGGHIGPLAVVRPDAMEAAFTTALQLAVETGAPQVSAFIAGMNATALRVAVRQGLRITLPMVVMSERDFGDWTSYLPRNPGFM